jgi:hypothetical protein
VFLIGLMLQIVLQRFPSGILPEHRMTAGARRDQPSKSVAERDATT